MIVSREFALAVLNLNDGYTLNDLSRSYYKILKKSEKESFSGSTFLDIVEQCRDFLENDLILQESPPSVSKVRCNIDLAQLYSKYTSLYTLLEKYDFSSIHSFAKVTISPLFKSISVIAKSGLFLSCPHSLHLYPPI